jgi:hypothetical protein
MPPITWPTSTRPTGVSTWRLALAGATCFMSKSEAMGASVSMSTAAPPAPRMPWLATSSSQFSSENQSCRTSEATAAAEAPG